MQKLNSFVYRFTLGAAVAALPLTALAQMSAKPSPSAAGGTTPAADSKFVRAAAEGGMAEVELGKLATEKASSEEVKKFGERMVNDHTKANDQLKQVAENKGIQLPDKLSPKDQMTKEHLSKLSGEQFDKAYMNDMVKDHTQDVADFKRESNSGTDADVKNFAATTLPTIEDHLKQAKEIAPSSRSASNNMKGSQ